MRRNFSVGVESKLRNPRPELGAGGLEFVGGVLAHQQTAADAAYEDGDLVAVPIVADAIFTKALGSLARGHGGTGGKPVEIPAHQLRRPALGHVARECHRTRLMIDRKDGPDDVVVRPFGIENTERKQQPGAG